MAHRGQCGRLGQGCITGHQNRMAVQKKQACSTLCHPGERKPSSYRAGSASHSTHRKRDPRHDGRYQPRGHNPQSRPSQKRAERLFHKCAEEDPCNSGSIGCPNKISGGATIISSRCCVMCA